MKAVIYARYSSASQTEQSIEGQLRECTEYANKHDINIVGTYIDRATSGTTDKREQFQKMIKDSDRRIFDAVIVYKIDRFARNRYDSAMYKARLSKNKVKVLYAKESIPDGPEGIILESLLEGMAEYYSAELSQKIKRGMRESAHKCHALGGRPPLGLKVADDKSYIIDGETAHIVKRIFEMYDDGCNTKQICDEMNSYGYKTSTGTRFNKNSLWVVLRNEKYIGVYEAAGVRVENGIPAIIEPELFERVQKKLVKNKRKSGSGKAKVNYMLSGKLYCGHCKVGMVGESGTSKTKQQKHYYYKCSARKKEKTCDKKTVRKSWLENMVVFHTLEHILKPGKIDTIASRCVEIAERERADNTEIKELKKRLTSVNQSINNIMTAIENGVFTKTTKTRLEELESAREKIEFEIDICKVQQPMLTEKHIIYLLSRFCPTSDEITDEYSQTIIDCFVNSVHLSDDKMIITYNLTNNKTELESSVIDSLTSYKDIDFKALCKGSDIIVNGGSGGIRTRVQNNFI